MNHFFKGYFGDFRVLIGYAGSGSFFYSEHFQAIAGMVLSAAMIILSILMQYLKVKSLMQDQRHKEEDHKQHMIHEEIEFQTKISKHGK